MATTKESSKETTKETTKAKPKAAAKETTKVAAKTTAKETTRTDRTETMTTEKNSPSGCKRALCYGIFGIALLQLALVAVIGAQWYWTYNNYAIEQLQAQRVLLEAVSTNRQLAWQLLNNEDVSGNGGKQEALQYLARGQQSLYGLNLSDEVHVGGAHLVGIVLRSAVLDRAQFQGANMNQADLSGAYLRQANFDRAQLVNTNLSSAQLQGASFVQSTLALTNFSNANLQQAIFDGAKMLAVNISGAQFLGARIPDVEKTMFACAGQMPSDLPDKYYHVVSAGAPLNQYFTAINAQALPNDALYPCGK